MPMLDLTLRTQALVTRGRYRVWEPIHRAVSWLPAETALVLCDVWNHHTCRGAEERLERMLPRMNELVHRLRDLGCLIVHAPSDTIPTYAGHPARQRLLAVPAIEPPADLPHGDPPLPVDANDPCDTCPDEAHPDWQRGMPVSWTRQHPAIGIDEARDVISADGRELYSYYHHRGIRHVLEIGVHTNMCILNRSFSIKQMVRRGMEPVLVRDLTDCMYNPAQPPYVPHDEATRLIVGYIEKFWCPTVLSDQLLKLD